MFNKSFTNSGGTVSDATQSELQTTTRTRRPARGFTFWLTTVDNDSDELTETELRQQSSYSGLVPRGDDIERGFHGDGFYPAQPPQAINYEKELPLPPSETGDPNFRTWRIDDNPFRGSNDPYGRSQQAYDWRR